MGACICNENSKENTKEVDMGLRAKSGNQNQKKTAELEVYESTNIKSLQQEEFLTTKFELAKTTKYETYDMNNNQTANPEVEMTIAEPNNQQQIAEIVELEAEDPSFDYSNFSKEVYTYFNRVRLNPEKYQVNFSNGKNILNNFLGLKAIVEELKTETYPKETILWSQRLHQLGYKFLQQTKQNTEADAADFDPDRYVKKNFEKEYEYVTLYANCEGDAEAVVETLLANNLSSAKIAISGGFEMASVSVGPSLTPGYNRVVMYLLHEQK